MLRAALGIVAMLLLAFHLTFPAAASSGSGIQGAELGPSTVITSAADAAEEAASDPSERGACMDHCPPLLSVVAGTGPIADPGEHCRAAQRLASRDIGVAVPPPQAA